MPKALQPRSGSRRPPSAAKPPLPKELLDEIRRTARPSDQETAIAKLSRAVDLLERGDAKVAVAEAQLAKAAAPRSVAVREVLGLALYGVGRWQEAAAELKAYRRMSGMADQNHVLADCLRALGKPSEAIPLAEEELRSKAPHEAKAEAVIVASSALADQKRYAEALAFLGRAKTRENVSEPYTLRLWYVRGDILAKAGRREEAAEEFRKIMRHDSSAFDAAERLAELS